MIFVENDNKILKYNIIVDIDELAKIRNEIFYELSKKSNMYVEDYLENKDFFLSAYNFKKHIRDFKVESVHKINNKNLYKISYIYYDYPKVVDMIDDLIYCYGKFNNCEELACSLINYNNLDNKYLDKIKSCISFNLINYIDKEKYDEVINFLEEKKYIIKNMKL